MSRENDSESCSSDDAGADAGPPREHSPPTDDRSGAGDGRGDGSETPAEDRPVTRRAALRAGLVGVGAATAGCTGWSARGQRQETPTPADNQSDGTETADEPEYTWPRGDDTPDVSELDLVLEDRFGSGELDTSTWKDLYPWDSRTHNYNGYAAPENAYVEDGRLVLLAEDEATEDRDYTTGVVSAKQVLKPGYFEASIKVPPIVQGFWPAYWLTSASHYPPEIDIFEFFGADPEAYMAYHFLDSDGQKQKRAETWGGPPFSEDFHTYSVDWDPPEKIAWYIDGVERFRYDGPHVSDEYCNLILNFGIDRPGDPPPRSEDLPATYEVDWIRCWER